MGPPGCGKSSLLNTIFASFSNDKWREIAESGSHGGSGGQINYQLVSFPKERYYTRKTDSFEDDEILMPTFIDLMGFENSNQPWDQELLKIVFYGRMQEGEKFKDVLHEVKDHYENNDISHLREKYRQRDKYLKIDRIIVVCSGDPDEVLPEELLKCIMAAAKGERNIPVYGVMTKADKFNGKKDPKVEEREGKFRKLLGIPLHRFQRVANYCENVDPDMKYRFSVIPKLDVKVLTLMEQVFSGDLPVINPDHDPFKETKEGARPMPVNDGTRPVGAESGTQPPPVKGQNLTKLLIIIALQVVLLGVLLKYAFMPAVTDEQFNKMCEEYEYKKVTKKVEIALLDSICPKRVNVLKPNMMVLGGGITAILCLPILLFCFDSYILYPVLYRYIYN